MKKPTDFTHHTIFKHPDHCINQIATRTLKSGDLLAVFNEERFTMHSPRLGGEDVLFNDPIHIPINYDYIYVKDVSFEAPAAGGQNYG